MCGSVCCVQAMKQQLAQAAAGQRQLTAVGAYTPAKFVFVVATIHTHLGVSTPSSVCKVWPVAWHDGARQLFMCVTVFCPIPPEHHFHCCDLFATTAAITLFPPPHTQTVVLVLVA